MRSKIRVYWIEETCLLLYVGISLAYYNSLEILSEVSSRICKVKFVVFAGEVLVYKGGRGCRGRIRGVEAPVFLAQLTVGRTRVFG